MLDNAPYNCHIINMNLYSRIHRGPQMSHFITRFPLVRFKELIPLLLRCFPDFWEARLAENKYSFPYDLKLFAARIDDRLMGCIGIHEYQFHLDGDTYPCGGVSDVAVDPDYQGRGYALKLQQFVLEYCQTHYKSCSLLPLYTDKAGVYTRLGWQIYESDNSNEIKTSDFPPQKTFQFDAGALNISCLKGQRPPETQEEKKALKIMTIYLAGKNFNGKCCRSPKTWWELFTGRDHFWTLKDDTFFLYRNDTLLEGYSSDPAHQVSLFTPRHGGHDSNKVMVNLPVKRSAADRRIAEALANKSFVFPAADVF